MANQRECSEKPVSLPPFLQSLLKDNYLIYLFSRYLLSPYYVAGTMLVYDV